MPIHWSTKSKNTELRWDTYDKRFCDNSDTLSIVVQFSIGKYGFYGTDQVIIDASNRIHEALRESLQSSLFLPKGLVASVWTQPIPFGKFDQITIDHGQSEESETSETDSN